VKVCCIGNLRSLVGEVDRCFRGLRILRLCSVGGVRGGLDRIGLEGEDRNGEKGEAEEKEGGDILYRVRWR
jgi:hypothetical protein